MASYIKGKELYEEIVISLNQNKLTKRAEELLYLIAKNANKKLSYVNPMDRDDCVSSAMFEMLKYWNRFNPEKTNAFAYYTQIAKNGYAKGWGALHPQKYKDTISYNSTSNSDGIYTI